MKVKNFGIDIRHIEMKTRQKLIILIKILISFIVNK